jgi:hypothetical protein
MSDYAGPLQRLALSRTLWLVLLWPLLGAVWQLLVARRGVSAEGSVGRRETALARHMAMAALVLTATSALAHAVLLARLPPAGHALLQPLLAGLRLGLFDASFALWFDPLSAAGVLLACLVALGAAMVVPHELPPALAWRAWAWILVSLEGALIAFLADGLVMTAFAWSLVAVAGAGVAGWGDDRVAAVAATRGAAAILLLLLGGSALFGGLAGAWDPNDVERDTHPRFVVADMASGPAAPLPAGSGTSPVVAEGQGAPPAYLTMTDATGVQVFVDEARAVSLRSPFVHVPIVPGSHSFRLRLGPADEVTVGHVLLQSGQDVALVPLGPMLAFRALAGQAEVRDRAGNPVLARTLQGQQGPGGLAVAPAIVVLWLLATMGLSAFAPLPQKPSVLAAVAGGATVAPIGPFFLARVGPLVSLTPHGDALLASVGDVVLVAAAVGALRRKRATAGLLAFAGSATPGIALVALGAGGRETFLEAMCAAGFAAAGIHLVAARRAQAEDVAAAFDPPAEGSLASLLLLRLPERLGGLLVRMEQWVVGGLAEAVANLARAVAWVVAMADAHVLAVPFDRAASRLVRMARGLVPAVGLSPAGVAWAVLGVLGTVVLAQAVWRAG